MKILNSILDILDDSGAHPEIGLTIGNFDGVHLGHRQLLSKIKQDCLKKKNHFTVVTFIPHPQKILHPEKDRFLINSYEKRRSLLEELGVDYLIELKFTRDFSTLPPEDFLKDYLLSYPALKCFYLGYDFAFGANKEGGYDLVHSLCESSKIEVQVQPKFEFKNVIVSSSLIREKLLSGKIAEVDDILSRPFQLEGLVIKGEGRGKMIGFPTANIQVSDDLIVPQHGVYVTKTIYSGMIYKSVTNIGNNPTFKDSKILNIETHLFDFDKDIYGESIEIEFLHKLRDEKKFPTVNDLVNQIKLDIIEAKKFLETK